MKISVILNAYNRIAFLKEQIAALQNQSVKPKNIFLWQNKHKNTSILESKLIKNIIYSYNNFNYGVWARFAFALNAKTEFICIFDDDTIPGRNWLKNCLETMKSSEGLLGARGVRFGSLKQYVTSQEFGWNNPNNVCEMVDIVGHSWFFKREWLSYFWRELPNLNSSNFVGEDIHFSYILQKYLKLNTYVPPHPKNDVSLWGSNPKLALKIGTDKSAISFNPKHQHEMDKALIYYIKKGFKLKFLKKKKLRNLYLEKKINISRALKKIIK